MKPKFIPDELFGKVLEWAVIPTIDLVVEFQNKGVIILRRKIPPYQNQWALPGLRIYKGETIEDTISRIAQKELSLKVDPRKRVLIDQVTAKFKTEHERQDLSTCYLIKASQGEIQPNLEHFSSYRLIKKDSEIPTQIGGMYKQYLRKYFKEFK